MKGLRIVVNAFLIVTVVALILLGSPVGAGAEQQLTVEIDGQLVEFSDQPPVVIDGRTLVPIRSVFEQMGYDVEWDDSVDVAILTNGKYTIRIQIGSNEFERIEHMGVGAAHRTDFLDVPAQVINGRTMIPLRAVLESVNCTVRWTEYNNKVTIETPAPAPETSADATDRVKDEANSSGGYNIGGPINLQPPGTYKVCATCKGTGMRLTGGFGMDIKCPACGGIGVFNRVE